MSRHNQASILFAAGLMHLRIQEKLTFIAAAVLGNTILGIIIISTLLAAQFCQLHAAR